MRVILLLFTLYHLSGAQPGPFSFQSGCGYTFRNGDCPGNDIAPSYSTSVDECEKLCNDNPACKGFSYWATHSTCIPKTASCETTVSYDTWNFYTKECSSGEDYVEVQNHHGCIEGGNLGNIGRPTAQGISKDANARCEFVKLLNAFGNGCVHDLDVACPGGSNYDPQTVLCSGACAVACESICKESCDDSDVCVAFAIHGRYGPQMYDQRGVACSDNEHGLTPSGGWTAFVKKAESGDVRLEEIDGHTFPQMYYEGAWHPVIANFLWNNQYGFDRICKNAGYSSGRRGSSCQKLPPKSDGSKGDGLFLGECEEGVTDLLGDSCKAHPGMETPQVRHMPNKSWCAVTCSGTVAGRRRMKAESSLGRLLKRVIYESETEFFG